MNLNLRAFLQLLKEDFDNNQARMAKELGINRTHINRIITTKGKCAGAIVCGAIIKYCDKNKLDFRDYIFLL